MTMLQEFQKNRREKQSFRICRKLFNARDDIIEKGTFPNKDNVFKTKEEESEENKLEKIKDDYKKFVKYIENESKGINYDLFKDYFDLVVPSALAKRLFETKNKKKNSVFVEKTKNRWSNVKDETEKMFEDENKTEQPDKILKIVKEIIDFNKRIRKQQGLGLKILAPNQMLSRLPIILAHLKAVNNSEKLKN